MSVRKYLLGPLVINHSHIYDPKIDDAHKLHIGLQNVYIYIYSPHFLYDAVTRVVKRKEEILCDAYKEINSL